ncbi:MAG: hypothetical protein O7A06_11830 [Acidobacteria bacterium]|nr:hypothetical protein [Acidobacteriota bacterium]MCZ6491205.1 hypothetical protein [Acidobacteriota bacterium]
MGWLSEYYQQAMELGARHGVNPLIFAGIYVGAIPFFFASVYWIVHSYRQKKSLVLPASLAGFFFCSAYLYLILFGRDLAWYVYAIVVTFLGVGAARAYKQVRAKMSAAEDSPKA